MMTNWKDVARTCMEAADSGAMSFPQILGALHDAGFDGYAVDLRRGTVSYYRTDGDSVDIGTGHATQVTECFDAERIKAAVRDAQAQVSGYTYRGFCATLANAGCAGYLVSLSGKRVLYYARTGETQVEYFPGSQQGS